MDRILDFYRMQETDGLYLFWTKEILLALLIFGGFWFLGKFVAYALKTWGPRFTSFTQTDLDDRILAKVAPPLAFVVIFAGAYLAISSLPLHAKVQLVVSGTIFIINVIILVNIAYRITNELIDWYAQSVTARNGMGFDKQIMPLLKKLATIFLVGTGMIIVLKHFNYDILSLVTALGIGSLAIGMAAKDTLANMISGFTIMLDRPFRIGDRIQLGGVPWGDVVDIGLRSTKIKTMDNTLLIIPNSTLCNSNVTNMAFPDLRAKARVNVGVGYGSDVEMVKKLMVEIALEVPDVMREPVPEAFFTSFGDSALNMALFFWVDDYMKIFPVTDKVNSLIVKRFREKGVEIPYPIRTLYIEKDQQ